MLGGWRDDWDWLLVGRVHQFISYNQDRAVFLEHEATFAAFRINYEPAHWSTCDPIAEHRPEQRKLDKCDLCSAEERLKESLAGVDKFGLANRWF